MQPDHRNEIELQRVRDALATLDWAALEREADSVFASDVRLSEDDARQVVAVRYFMGKGIANELFHPAVKAILRSWPRVSERQIA